MEGNNDTHDIINKDSLASEIQQLLQNDATLYWGRSKIMIVGEGRAGKSALSNSLLGKAFSSTESTIGINQMTCMITSPGDEGDNPPINDEDGDSASARNRWNQHDMPTKEMELAVAKLMASKKLMLPSTSTQSEASSNETPNASSKASLDVDEGLVLKCLADNVRMKSKYLLSVFDFGGQSVFNVIHPFFLTRYGVYLIVFNMEWMDVDAPETTADGKVNVPSIRKQCFNYLKFWLNSVIIHTQSSTGTLAPILLVGTRKDKIPDPAKHSKISRLLHSEFESNLASVYIVPNKHGIGANGKATLMFFPVDNTQSSSDPVIGHIMTTIEKCLDDADYVHFEIPWRWICLYDNLKNTLTDEASVTEDGSRGYVTYDQVLEMSKQYHLTEEDIPKLLRFYHQMGMLMWHEDPALKDEIILDPMKYFVAPATNVICRHTPTEEDETHHVKEIHIKCRQMYFDDWLLFTKKGIISKRLLVALLSPPGVAESDGSLGQETKTVQKVIQLMRKYGLIVSLTPNCSDDAESRSNQSPSQPSGETSTSAAPDDKKKESAETTTGASTGSVGSVYLVPALLPPYTGPPNRSNNLHSNTVYFIFAPLNLLSNSTTFTWQDCMSMGFLPSGLFERLVAKSVTWCVETSSYEVGNKGDINWNYQDYEFFQNKAMLAFGNQKFTLQVESDRNAIAVIIDGSNPKVIYDRILEQLQSMISECMDSLEVIAAFFCTSLPLPPPPPQMIENEDGTVTIQDDPISNGGSIETTLREPLLLNFGKLENTISTSSDLELKVDGSWGTIAISDLQQRFGHWFKSSLALVKYDIFISYRWGYFDSYLSKGIFDGLSIYNVDKPRRSIDTFLDVQRLQDGRRFDSDFVIALTKSIVFVPIISAAALQRMRDHDDSKVDNVLIEWILALDCYVRQEEAQNNSSSAEIRLRRILPIMIGSISTTSNKIRNLFEEGILDELPQIVPKATIHSLESILSRPLHSSLTNITVHGILNQLRKFLCVNIAEVVTSGKKLIATCYVKIAKTLRAVLAESSSSQPQVEEEPTQNESTMSYHEKCKAHIDTLLQHIKDTIKEGTALWNDNKKSDCAALYESVCQEIADHLHANELKQPFVDALAQCRHEAPLPVPVTGKQSNHASTKAGHAAHSGSGSRGAQGAANAPNRPSSASMHAKLLRKVMDSFLHLPMSDIIDQELKGIRDYVTSGKPAPALLSRRSTSLGKGNASKKGSNNDAINAEQEKKIKEQAERIIVLEKEVATLTEQFKREHALRKKYMNEVEEVKGNMRVHLRIRPFNSREISSQAKEVIKLVHGSSTVQVETTRNGIKEFDFNTAFDKDATQEQVFNAIAKDSLRSVFDGYNVCYMAYGQAGGGKSYTMVGAGEYHGIIPRAIEEVYQIAAEMVSTGRIDCLITSYCVELYMDTIRDLYWYACNDVTKQPAPEPPKWEIKIDPSKMVYVQNGMTRVAPTKDELFAHYHEAMNMRTFGATQLNPSSSRGNVDFCIIIECYDKVAKKNSKAKLSFVDLVGIERATKTGATGDRLKEGAANNKALGALGDVLTALAEENQKFIPYRNNKLTQLLQDSLGGNAKTHMIVNVSPADSAVDDSMTAINYGQRARKITSTSSKTNDSEEVGRLKAIIARLTNGNGNVDSEPTPTA